jgi:2-oxoglutarate ferredoxin oxidoreductase subunit alpha
MFKKFRHLFMQQTPSSSAPTSSVSVPELIKKHRFVVKIGGESGQGVNSVGEIIAKSLKETGYYVYGYREYPSLIKGGYSMYQLDFSDLPVNAPSSHCDLLLCLSRVSVRKYLTSLRAGGVLIHTLRMMEFSEDQQRFIDENQISVKEVAAEKIAVEAGGTVIMTNTVMTGVLLQMLGLGKELVTRILKEEFVKKPALLDQNVACLNLGYELDLSDVPQTKLHFAKKPVLDDALLLTGNHALALGAVSAGVRAYYAYPMTPSSSILSYLANWYHQTGMLVKQVEDEISVAEMALGSMFMGTRALCGTSGGGFDLMTETVSLAGITETPFVCILGQRPGPATGLPTWTAQGDLNLAIYAGHGEYPRAVLAASDIESCYLLLQQAFNIAEKYQIPVMVLTEKQIAESLFIVEKMPEPLPIERHLLSTAEVAEVQSTYRYAYTENGISKRWFPGQSPAVFDGNGDEHLEDGSLTEEAEPVKAIYEKRMRKQETLLQELPEPLYFGDTTPDFVFVGWGSTKHSILDAMAIAQKTVSTPKIGYLHYEYMYPVRTETFKKLAEQHGQNLVLIENNYLGQLGALLTQETGYQFSQRLLKYDGRQFFVEEVLEIIQNWRAV